MKMNMSYDSQATADQDRNRYSKMTAQLGGLGFDAAIPVGVRAIAEKAVAQAHEVYNGSQDALDASIATFEKTLDGAGQEVIAFNRQIVALARRYGVSAFDLAESLAGAKDLAEIVELQRVYWQKQFGILTAQALGVSTLSTEIAARAAASVKAHVGQPRG